MSLVDASGNAIAPDTASLVDRRLRKEMGMNCTVGEAHEIAKMYANATIQQIATNFPFLVQKMIDDSAERNGWPVALIEPEKAQVPS